MEKYSFVVKEDGKGLRLDKFLVLRMPSGSSRSFIQRLIKESRVLVNGAPSRAHHKAAVGETVEVTLPEAESSTIAPQDLPVDIVYEDDDLLVVNKPAGMVVHPAPGNRTGTLVNALLYHCGALSEIGGVLRPGIVHRIDKGTSGLLVVAKNDAAHRSLARQFGARTIARTYVALVRGSVPLDSGVIELPIGRSGRDRKKMGVAFVRSKNAVTRYRVLKRFKDSTLIELKLGTGRTHQIRVHMAYIGNPILGDEKYGSHGLMDRPALHAKTLGFIHPGTDKYVEFDSQMPADMKEFIKKRS